MWLQSGNPQSSMLIECIPNVSEGRRPEVVAAMADAIRRVPRTRLLDFSSDPSHNRSVFTVVGDAVSLEQAVLALFERAVADIDLSQRFRELWLGDWRDISNKERRAEPYQYRLP